MRIVQRVDGFRPTRHPTRPVLPALSMRWSKSNPRQRPELDCGLILIAVGIMPG